MKKIFLDTETSAFAPGQICQITYIVEDNNQLVKRVNQYLKVDKVDEGASKVTGLTVEKLNILSGGMTFAGRAQEFYNDFKDAIVVAHNVDFDERFVNSEFARLGQSVWFKPKFCSMKYFTDLLKLPGRYGRYKWPKLSEVIAKLGIPDEYVTRYIQWLYGNYQIDAHDSRYDTVALYLAIKKQQENGVLDLDKYAMENMSISI